MRIEKLNIKKKITEKYGIAEINIKRLGQVVALIGRNGSGKSRILNLLEYDYLPKITPNAIIDGSLIHLPTPFKSITEIIDRNRDLFEIYNSFQAINTARTQFPDDPELQTQYMSIRKTYSSAVGTDPQKKELVRSFNQAFQALTQVVPILVPKYFKRIHHSEIRQLQNVISNQPSSSLDFEKIIEAVTDQDDYSEFNLIHSTALAYLAKLPHQLVDDLDDCYGDIKKFELRTSFKRFASLKKMIRAFLNKDLTWEKEKVNTVLSAEGVTRNSKGIWKLEGRLFNYSELSDGEKTLFAYSLLFFLLEQNPKIRIRESIVVVDEPELHLHPESEIAVIRGIKEIVKDKGQLWIATHSISILSDLDYDEIFMVKENSIVPPSRATPGNSFIELMGLDEHIEKLSHFIMNISNWAFLNFMVQCFEEPDTIGSARPDDPEVELFKRSIKEKTGSKLLLDFGAGKGRMFKEFTEYEIRNQNIEYYALEPNRDNNEELAKLNFKGIFNNYTDLPENKFDYILLCNVLHEVPVLEWADTLTKLSKALNDTGFLIIIEDSRLPKGEKIGEVGFIILDIESLQRLFSHDTLPGELLAADDRYKNRIQCALLSKSKIKPVTVKSILESLNILQKNTLNNIIELRNKYTGSENNLALGRESAFLSQLYINTIVATRKLEKE